MVTRLGSVGAGVGVGDGDDMGLDGADEAGHELGDGVAAARLGDGKFVGGGSTVGATGDGAQPVSSRPTAAPTSTFLMSPESRLRVSRDGLTGWWGWCSVPQVAR